MKVDYNKEYEKYVDGFLGSGSYKTYFKNKKTNEEADYLFPYQSEDDVVLRFYHFIEKTAKDNHWNIVVHGQKPEYVWKRKRKHGRFHEKMYRVDLEIYLLKQGKTNVKSRGIEKVAVEIKYVGSTSKKKLRSYDWLIRDVNKLNRLVRRTQFGCDRGYFLCIDETCSSKEAVTKKLPYLRGTEKLGVDLFYPKHTSSFGKAWVLRKGDSKIRRVILLKTAIVAKLEKYFKRPTVHYHEVERSASAVLKRHYGKRLDRLVIKNQRSKWGKANSVNIYFHPEGMSELNVRKSINRLSTAKGVLHVASKLAPKIKKAIKASMR